MKPSPLPSWQSPSKGDPWERRECGHRRAQGSLPTIVAASPTLWSAPLPARARKAQPHLSGARAFPPTKPSLAPPLCFFLNGVQLQDPPEVTCFVLTAAVALIFVNVNYNFHHAQTCSTHKTCLHTRGTIGGTPCWLQSGLEALGGEGVDRFSEQDTYLFL